MTRISLKWWIALALTALGGWLRFAGLGDRPLWIDEALFAFWVKDGGERQEWLSVWFAQAIGAESEFGLRFLSALAGTLTVPAIYLVSRNLYATGLVATFPLFVFWSQMARPYSLAGLFAVLGWRWWWFYIPALVATPVAIAGVRITKARWKVVAGLAILALGVFLIRPDVGRGWSIEMLLYHSRFAYVPSLAFVLYISDYLERQGKRIP